MKSGIPIYGGLIDIDEFFSDMRNSVESIYRAHRQMRENFNDDFCGHEIEHGGGWQSASLSATVMMGAAFLAGWLNWTGLYAAVMYLAALPFAHTQQPIPCLARSSISTLVQLARCFNNYTVPSDYYTLESYAEAQPNESQLQDWSQLVTAVLNGGKSAAVPASLQDILTVSSFTDASNGAEYCILSETYANSDNYYVKGWGLLIVPTNASLDIHLASPHPMFDFGTPDQAVTLFQLSGAKSLIISGRHRSAYAVATDCIPSTSATTYYYTDPTHDVVCLRFRYRVCIIFF